MTLIDLILFILIYLYVSAPAMAQMHHDHQEMATTEQHHEFRSMVHGRFFLTQSFIEGPRGENKFAAPNFLMWDADLDHGKNKVFGLSLMLTAEKWTFPKSGQPELFQIGEENKDHVPYIDAQHPHSGPIMGLTFSESFKWPELTRELKFSFAPRGESTDGPIVYLHRESASNNPDTPLGHHLAQDVGHISSTVFAASYKFDHVQLEASTFNGREPTPDEVDLPLRRPDSLAARLGIDLSDELKFLASAARVKDPEGDEGGPDLINRYSASLYYNQKFPSLWMVHNSIIVGLINFYDRYSKLRSFVEEFALLSPYVPHGLFGRLEILERGTRQLNIGGPDEVKWIKSLSIGYTYDFLKNNNVQLGLGSMASFSLIPPRLEASYGKDPMSGKVFLHFSFTQ